MAWDAVLVEVPYQLYRFYGKQEIVIEELKNALENTINKIQNKNEDSNVMEEYNRYERRKVFFDNQSWKGNDFAWVMDEGSVCISEHGDGGATDLRLMPQTSTKEVYSGDKLSNNAGTETVSGTTLTVNSTSNYNIFKGFYKKKHVQERIQKMEYFFVL